MTFHITHPKTQEECARIAQFQVDMAWESEGAKLDKNIVLRGVQMAVEDPEAKGRYYIAKSSEPLSMGETTYPAGTVVGSLFLTREWSDWHCEWYWWIQSVFVNPHFRRMGAYRALYDEVIRQAKEKNVHEVRLYVDKENVKSQATYQHLGMQESHYLLYTREL
jgi:ribosomal protein S18 acetylase RimI-like enzyme